LDRRRFIKMLGLGTTGLAVSQTAFEGLANPGRRPGPATVALARADHVFLEGVFAPEFAYPEGKIDYASIETVVDGAMQALTGERRAEAQWAKYVGGQDRVGIMVDVHPLPVPIILAECIIDRLIKTGIKQQAIFVFAAGERELFAAGYSLDRDRPGVKAYATDSEGFRNGFSRLVLDRCDVVINLARLRPHATVGLAGAVHNHLALVPSPQRIALRRKQTELPSAAARPVARHHVKVHLLDTMNPAYQVPPPPGTEFRWPYGGLLASEDPVALDVIGKQILEAKRAQVKGEPWPLEPEPEYLRTAQTAYALGQADPELISVVRTGYAGDALI